MEGQEIMWNPFKKKAYKPTEEEIEQKRKNDKYQMDIVNFFYRVDEPYRTQRDFNDHMQIDILGAIIRVQEFGIEEECCR